MDLDRFSHLHKAYPSCAGSFDIGIADNGTKTLKAARTTDPMGVTTSYAINIETLKVTIETSAAFHLTFQDSSGVTFLEATDDNPGANTPYEWEWPGGKSLHAGDDFVVVISGAGLKAHIQWTGTVRHV